MRDLSIAQWLVSRDAEIRMFEDHVHCDREEGKGETEQVDKDEETPGSGVGVKGGRRGRRRREDKRE